MQIQGAWGKRVNCGQHHEVHRGPLPIDVSEECVIVHSIYASDPILLVQILQPGLGPTTNREVMAGDQQVYCYLIRCGRN